MNAVSEIQPTAATTPAAPASSSTPGALLRHEREQRGLTVQQVSEELHLDAWLVEALEQNRFLALGAPVYAKGHLRKYAVLLGLSPELILARYQVIAEPPPPVQLPPRAALLTPDPLPRSFDWRRLVPKIEWQRIDWRMYGLIAAVLLTASTVWLVAYYLRASSSEASQVAQTQIRQPQSALPAQVPKPEAPEQQAAPQPMPNVGPAITAPVPPTRAAVQPQPAAVAMAPPPAGTAPARPFKTPAASPLSGSLTAAMQPPQPRLAASRPAKVEPQKPATATPKVAAVPLKPAAAPQQRTVAITPAKQPGALQSKLAVPAAPAPLPEIPQVSLRLEFAVASWAEVYDGDGRRLLYAVGDPNRARTVSGKPPLKVTLGMAGSVQARVNGRPIAIPRRIGQDSASFTVGPNGSIR